MSQLDRVVAVARSERPDYGELPSAVQSPELPAQEVTSVAGSAIRQLLREWGLDSARFGSPNWNPLAELIPKGSRVVIKPNWVNHFNKSGEGLDCLLTDTSVLEAVVNYVALARPSSIVIGDAPIQGCDFDKLRSVLGLDQMLERVSHTGMTPRIADFRRTLLTEDHVGAARVENARATADYVLVDLGSDSLLEPLAADAEKFRVTMYNPDLLQRSHSRGRHQYLIAREVLQADVVINLPKLKSHKKAAITGALKNLVGINGNKEFLPHHRKGGSTTGGDCYVGGSWLKYKAEDLLDSANRGESGALPAMKARLAELAVRGASYFGHDSNLEGSWYGNDTVWRTCLDLQRVLRYASDDGQVMSTPQRLVISITDAIIAGQKDGPLAPTPMPAGFVTGALSPAAAEWVHARLMGFDPCRIPLVRHAFDQFPLPLTDFRPSDIRVLFKGMELDGEKAPPFPSKPFEPPSGWKGHVELQTR